MKKTNRRMRSAWAARAALAMFAFAFILLCVPQTAKATTTAENGVVIADKWQQNAPLLMDYADLLSSSEESALLAKLEEISARQGMDVAIVTDDSLYGKTDMEYADDYYDYCGLGQGIANSGVIFSLNMEDRSYWISTAGDGISAFTDYGISYIGDEVRSYLSEGDYYGGLTHYADLADAFITEWKTNGAFDVNHQVPENFPLARNALIATGAGAATAFGAGATQKSKLKSVRKAYGAEGYITPGSMQLYGGHDMFINRTIQHIPIPKQSSGGGSSTHHSSSGVSHGGGGGHF